MKHLVRIGHDNKAHGLNKSMFLPGEKVCFTVPQPSDASLRVTSEQVGIKLEGGAPMGMLAYSFIMPDSDVIVKITATCDMEHLPLTGPADPTAPSPITAPGADSTAGNRLFCPERGAQLEKGQKFCPECGYDVRPLT